MSDELNIHGIQTETLCKHLPNAITAMASSPMCNHLVLPPEYFGILASFVHSADIPNGPAQPFLFAIRLIAWGSDHLPLDYGEPVDDTKSFNASGSWLTSLAISPRRSSRMSIEARRGLSDAIWICPATSRRALKNRRDLRNDQRVLYSDYAPDTMAPSERLVMSIDRDGNVHLPALLRCAKDGWAPWGLVCRHLIDGTATEWIPVPPTDFVDTSNDWLCLACWRKGPDDLRLEDVMSLCIHCIRKHHPLGIYSHG
jgi:hypothetical protein